MVNAMVRWSMPQHPQALAKPRCGGKHGRSFGQRENWDWRPFGMGKAVTLISLHVSCVLGRVRLD